MRALLSVTDKTGISAFAHGLVELGYEILSTGGTAKFLIGEGLTVTEVADVTGFPEILDGRVKTLHPSIHGGLLADLRLPAHKSQLDAAGIAPIDVACVNLYAFEKTVTGSHSLDDAIESIDIGGPAMIRAAAKNHASVTILVDPLDYERVLSALKAGSVSELRPKLAAKAFRHTAFYDSMVSRYLSKTVAEELPETFTLGFRRRLEMRYGENPHQTAALYTDPLGEPGIAQAQQIWGKDLSYNNILDGDAAWELVADLAERSCAIIKHGNPCGAASLDTCAQSFRVAKSSDTVSAFGGVAAFHGRIDLAAAEAMCEKGNFLEVVIGTEFDDEAVELFRNREGWGQNVRLLAAPLPPSTHRTTLRTVGGGVLVQSSDEHPAVDWRVVTKRAPSESEWEALRFAWSVVPHVKSNAIVVCQPGRLIGTGAGQMNRVQSVRLALDQAQSGAVGAVLASDAFFPFPDSVVTAAEAGIAALIQPGGSKKDSDVIAKADELGVAMVMTGTRHFRH